jgi:hypothetical protein
VQEVPGSNPGIPTSLVKDLSHHRSVFPHPLGPLGVQTRGILLIEWLLRLVPAAQSSGIRGSQRNDKILFQFGGYKNPWIGQTHRYYFENPNTYEGNRRRGNLVLRFSLGSLNHKPAESDRPAKKTPHILTVEVVFYFSVSTSWEFGYSP